MYIEICDAVYRNGTLATRPSHIVIIYPSMNPSKVVTILIGVIAAIAFALVLKISQAVILPLVVSVLLSFIFTPLVKFLLKKGIPRIFAIALVLLLLLGFFLLLGLFLVTSIQSFVQEYPVYLAKLKEIAQDFTHRYLAVFNLPEDPLATLDISRFLTDSLISGSKALLGLLGILMVITIILIFLFLETSNLSSKLAKAFPSHTSKRIRVMLEHATRQVSRYLSVKFYLSLLTGILVWFLLTVLGLDFPVVWGALAFFLNFVPNIGHIIVVVLVGLQTLVQTYPSLGLFLFVIGALTVCFAVIGSLLEPKLAGDRLNVSPVVILASLLFWGWIWGVVGALISVPIAVSIKIVCENIPALKPVGILMGAGHFRKRRTRGKIPAGRA